MIKNNYYRRAMGLAVAGAFGSTAWAAPEVITTFWGNSYSENFNTLSTAAGNQTTVPTNWLLSEDGGFSAGNGYTFNSGTDARDLHSYATTSGTTDRALGIQDDGSNAANRMFGIVFQNNTGSTINQISLSYLAERWYRPGNDSDQLDFEYSQTTASGSGDVFVANAGNIMTTWKAASSHDFSVLGTDTAGPTSTKVIAGKIVLDDATAINVAPGGYFAIRWRDSNGGGSKGWGLAVDDLYISVPEPWQPAAVAGLGLLGLLGWKQLRLRKNAAH